MLSFRYLLLAALGLATVPAVVLAEDTACLDTVDIACSMEEFSTLCTAIEIAGLRDALSEGSWTVFAPTNQAFGNLEDSVLDTVLNNTALLTDILLFHAVPAVVSSSDLVCTASTTMANGQASRTVCSGGNISQKGGSNPRDALPMIVEPDVATCQGYIHVVDQVMLPADLVFAPVPTEPPVASPTEPPVPAPTDAPVVAPIDTPVATPSNAPVAAPSPEGCQTIAEIACGTEDFSTLCAVVTAAGLGEALSGETRTVFAPTNAAFSNLDPALLEAVLADTELLTDILLFHTVSGVEVMAADLLCSTTVEMGNGDDSRTVCRNGGNIFQKGGSNPRDMMPEIIAVDIAACNGVVHVVSEVMLP